MAHAWVIDKDHLFPSPGFEDYSSEAGTAGPHDAPDHLLRQLAKGEGHVFRMYDDDGEIYYTGRGIADAEDVGSEEFCYAPLGDFGGPNAGAVVIRWQGHPEWECG